jgi:hypothetical protein
MRSFQNVDITGSRPLALYRSLDPTHLRNGASGEAGLVVVFNHHCDATAIEDSVLRVAPLRRIRTALKDAPVLPASLRRHLA